MEFSQKQQINRARRLIASHSFFFLSRRLFQIFMTLFIWQATESIQVLAVFYITFLIAHSTAFTVFAHPIKTGKLTTVKTAGLFGVAVFYFTLFILGENASAHLTWLAAMGGFFNGMYWISYHVQSFDATTHIQRGRYMGAERASKILTSLIAPLLGGYIITAGGYEALFIFAGLLQIGAAATGAINFSHLRYGSFHPIATFRCIKQQRDQVKLLVSGALANASYERPMRYLLILYLFFYFQNELDVGGWITIFSIISLLTVYGIGRFVPYNKMKHIALAAGGSLGAAIATIALYPSVLTYIIFGSVKEMAGPLLSIIKRTYQYNILQKMQDYGEHRVEFIVISEWIRITIGSLVGFLPLLFITDPSPTIIMPLLLLYAVITFSESLLIRSVKST